MTQEIRKLASLGDLLDYYKEVSESEADDAPDFELEGELATLSILFDGKNYKASLPSGCIRGLWEYQQSLYRGASVLLYGKNSIRNLSNKKKKAFELVFEVSSGSTGVSASLEKFFSELGKGLSDMDSKDKKQVLLGAILIIAMAWSSVAILDSNQDTKRLQITSQLDASKQQEQTRQFELLTQQIENNGQLAKLAILSAEGTRSIIKGAADADFVRVGRIHFNREEVLEVNSRSPRAELSADVEEDDYLITRIEPRDGSVRLSFTNGSGEDFTDILDEELFDSVQIDKLWESAKSRKPVTMEVSITRNGDAVRGSQVLAIK